MLFVAAAGWYGTWATYSNGYDRGKLDTMAEKKMDDWWKGYNAGKLAGHKEAETENSMIVDQQLRQRLQVYQEGLATQYSKAVQQAYNAGMAAEAKAIIDHDMRFAAGATEGKK